MKVYEKVIIDIETGKVIEEQSFEYEGPLALCEPVSTIAAIGSAAGAMSGSTLLTVAGAGLGIFGDIFSGIQQRKAAKADEKGKKIEAQQLIDQSRERARRSDQEADELYSSQIARLGASGVDVLGSPLEVIMHDARKGKLRSRDIEYEGDIGAANKRYEAKLARFKAGQALPNALFSIGGRVIGAGKTILGSQTLGGVSDSYSRDLHRAYS